MDGASLDQVGHQRKLGVGRRALLAALAAVGLPVAAGRAPDGAEAKKKKITLCRNGQTITVSRSKKKALLKRGATPGACPPQPPSCLPATANLQAAVNAAPPGATLTLCAGRRVLAATVDIGQDLTLVGAGAGQTILDGGDAVRVLRIGELARVTVRDLTVTRGRVTGQQPDDGAGGGIFTLGVLTLTNVTVASNAGVGGGGIFTRGALTLGAGSVVTANDAAAGAGVVVDAAGTLTMQSGSRVSGNTASDSVGGVFSLGTLILEAGSRVSGNTAAEAAGGIASEGQLVLKDGSVVGGDRPEDANSATIGGGIVVEGGVTTLEAGSRVTGNTASERGGGILNGGALTLNDGSSVSGNTAGTNGGGIFANGGSVTLKPGSRVTNNTAATGAGGGIFRAAGVVSLEAGSEVTGNAPDNCDPDIGACT